jgi:hypothetical protein
MESEYIKAKNQEYQYKKSQGSGSTDGLERLKSQILTNRANANNESS